MTTDEAFAQLAKQMEEHRDALDNLYHRHNNIKRDLTVFGTDLKHQRNSAVSMLSALRNLRDGR